MNKIYLFTAAFAVMASLSGCSDTELASIDTAQEKTPIGFHTVGSQMGSRADIINSENLTSTDFKVYAFDGDGEAFMGMNDTGLARNGVEINHKTGEWDYANGTDRKYWPGTVKPLNFYAVNPATFDTDLAQNYGWQINKDHQEIHYTCINEYGLTSGTKNIDVMYATAKNQTKDSNAGKVKLTFKHILSQIAFKAKTQDVNTKVEIESIVIHNVISGGTFVIPTEGSTGTGWSPKENLKQNFTIGMNSTTAITVDNIGTEVFTKPILFVPQKLEKWATTTSTPKTIAAADATKECYLEISCKISIDETYPHGTATQFESLYIPFEADWQPGKRYVYTLIFGGGYTVNGNPVLTPVSFEPSVETWVNEDKDINIQH